MAIMLIGLGAAAFGQDEEGVVTYKSLFTGIT